MPDVKSGMTRVCLVQRLRLTLSIVIPARSAGIQGNELKRSRAGPWMPGIMPGMTFLCVVRGHCAKPMPVTPALVAGVQGRLHKRSSVLLWMPDVKSGMTRVCLVQRLRLTLSIVIPARSAGIQGNELKRSRARPWMPGIKPGMTALLLAAMLAVIASPARAATLPRVASTTVCADQYVLALAAPRQIVALSAYAREPSLSYYAARAQGFPKTGGTAEELIALKPDIVLTDGYGLREARKLLARQKTRLLMLPAPESFDGVAEAVRAVAAAIGRQAAGEEAAAELARRKEALAQSAPLKRESALYLLPSGSTAGSFTFIDDVLRAAGATNYAAARGLQGWGRVSLETLVRHPPDVLVLGFFDRRARSATAGFAANPVFLRVLAHTARIEVPNALWICAGPMLIEAAEHVAARLRAEPGAIVAKSAP